MTKSDAGEARGTASDATVSTVAPDDEARKAILGLIEKTQDEGVKAQLQSLADSFAPAWERELQLATECEWAAEAITEKIEGMEATRKTKLAEAKMYRAHAEEMKKAED